MKLIIQIRKFISKQIIDIKTYGVNELLRKFYLFFKVILRISANLVAVIPCIIIRLLSPWLIIRIERILADNYAQFANDPAVYYCKKKLKIDQLTKKHIDLVYIHYNDKIYNKQLARMWKRRLNFFSGYFLDPINRVNRLFPGFQTHTITDITPLMPDGSEKIRSALTLPRDGDIKIEKCQPLEFTQEEEIYGKNLLNKFGLKDKDKFVCLAVRDGTYQLKKFSSRFRDWSYHDYRHWDLDNFLLASEELTKKGYYVFRVGVVVKKEFKSDNPKIIDYANSSLRNDFMDVFLGAKCSFCLGTASGFDCVPNIFRKPMISLSIPFGDIHLHSDRFLILTKHHYLKKENRRLTLSEIFSYGVAFAYDTKIFEQKGIELIDNTPEEIKDVAIEMAKYLEKKNLNNEEEELQKTFRNLYSRSYKSVFKDLKNNKVQKAQCIVPSLSELAHNKILCRFSTKFLKDNKSWLK